MTAFVALLRAVNVGGTGRLGMKDLTRLCTAAGFEAVRTYIASGNVVFRSAASEEEVKAALEAQLLAHAGQLIGVVVRTAAQMAEVSTHNPFPAADPSRTVAIFLDEPPAPSTLQEVVGRVDEEVRLGHREIYVAYGDRMGRSKLRIPSAKGGTARNMTTITKLAELAADAASA